MFAQLARNTFRGYGREGIIFGRKKATSRTQQVALTGVLTPCGSHSTITSHFYYYYYAVFVRGPYKSSAGDYGSSLFPSAVVVDERIFA